MLVLMALVTTFMTGPLLTWFGKRSDLPQTEEGRWESTEAGCASQ
jgi:hypothetical protein